MNNDPKYVVVENDGFEFPFVFPNLITHSDFARCINGKVISAGFCYITNNGEFEVYGKSVSESKTSRPEDAKLLTKYLIGH